MTTDNRTNEPSHNRIKIRAFRDGEVSIIHEDQVLGLACTLDELKRAVATYEARAALEAADRPAGTFTEAQIEAAAKALHETRNPWIGAYGDWGAAGFGIKQAFRESARSALEAATPERDTAVVAIEVTRKLHHKITRYGNDYYSISAESYEDDPSSYDDLEPFDLCAECYEVERLICEECGGDAPIGHRSSWPCPTVAALDGAPEPETPELFPGTNAALDRLTVRKAEDANAFCIEHGNFHAVELGDPTCEFEDGFGEPVGGETDGE